MKGIDGWISIQGLRCTGRQGTTAAERRRTSDYLVDVAVRGDLGPAVSRDELAAAFDIAALARVTRRTVAERPRTLIERIAGDVAIALLDDFSPVSAARVRVEKRRPRGLGADAEAAELTLTRTQLASATRRSRAAPRRATRS